MRNEDGFTLVELLVVLVIIGFLVGITVPIYNSVTLGAQQAVFDSNLRILNGAVVMYQVGSGGALPADISDLDPYIQGTAADLPPDGAAWALVNGVVTGTRPE